MLYTDVKLYEKGILLSLLAVILLAVVVCAIWYINEEGKMRAGSKDSFIPYNSAVVVTINAGAELAPEIRQAFAADLKVFRRKLLVRITDTLQQQGLVKAHPYVVAARVEGKSDVAFLYVMDNKDVISRGEVTDFLNRTFAAGGEKVRKYDRHKIYTLKQGKEIALFCCLRRYYLVVGFGPVYRRRTETIRPRRSRGRSQTPLSESE